MASDPVALAQAYFDAGFPEDARRALGAAAAETAPVLAARLAMILDGDLWTAATLIAPWGVVAPPASTTLPRWPP